jgi:hypothetical protein
MALFRFHRGGLAESLATTVVVKTIPHLMSVISETMDSSSKWGARMTIEPYPWEGNNFDPRCGWYTHIVLANILEQDKMHPVGFLSEFLD